jgi:hypothetical protein
MAWSIEATHSSTRSYAGIAGPAERPPAGSHPNFNVWLASLPSQGCTRRVSLHPCILNGHKWRFAIQVVVDMGAMSPVVAPEGGCCGCRFLPLPLGLSVLQDSLLSVR